MATTKLKNTVAEPKPKNKNTLYKMLKSWQLYVMVIPTVLYYILFHYKPMYGILMAFQDFNIRDGILGSEWVGFENFTRFFSSHWFSIILQNTLTLSVMSLVIGFPLPIILAIMVNEMTSRRRKHLFQTVSYAPHFISVVVSCSMIIMFLNPSTGIFNKVIELFGGEPIFFMQEGEMFKWIYTISGIWETTGWSAIIYFAALSGVDQSLIEAAQVDGATRLQRIWHIIIPVLVPTMITLLILRCGQMLTIGHEKVFLLQNDVTLDYSEVISTYVYKMGLIQNDFSFSTAVGLFNSVINSILLICANRFAKKLNGTSLW